MLGTEQLVLRTFLKWIPLYQRRLWFIPINLALMDYLLSLSAWPDELILGSAVTQIKLSRLLDVHGFYRCRWLRIGRKILGVSSYTIFVLPSIPSRCGGVLQSVFDPCPTRVSKLGSSYGFVEADHNKHWYQLLAKLVLKLCVFFSPFVVLEFMAAIWILWHFCNASMLYKGYIFTVGSWWSKLLLERRWSLQRNLALESGCFSRMK